MLLTANELNVKDTFSKCQSPAPRVTYNRFSTAEFELVGLLLRFRMILQAENQLLGASTKVTDVTKMLNEMIAKGKCNTGAHKRLGMQISDRLSDFMADKGLVYVLKPERRVYITRKQFIRLPK